MEQIDNLWFRGQIGSEVHIIPPADLIDHDPNDACACQPHIVPEDDGFLVVHNAWDGRE